jgi:hypothetical protein
MSGPTPVAASPRIAWTDVPEPVRAAVADALGSPVASAATQLGGFSPGAAVRVVCMDGSRAFVKACGSSLNPDSPGIHRAEIRALRLMPPDVPHARLLSSYDDGDWVALVLEDVDGHRPAVPWSEPDLSAVATALEQVAARRAPEQLPAFAEATNILQAWDQVAADPAGVPEHLLDRLPEFLDRQALAREVSRGDRLVHWDARADNVLIRDSRAVLLDWAWTSRGAPWLDTLLLAMDFRIQGGPDPDVFLATAPVTRDVPPAHLASVVAGMVGVWAERMRLPPPPGLPTIRAWQAHCHAAALAWLDQSALWS